jgi:hypothetical protein
LYQLVFAVFEKYQRFAFDKFTLSSKLARVLVTEKRHFLALQHRKSRKLRRP